MCTVKKKSKPCTTCTIKICKYNKNPLRRDETMKTAIELNIEKEIFKRKGCPYDT